MRAHAGTYHLPILIRTLQSEETRGSSKGPRPRQMVQRYTTNYGRSAEALVRKVGLLARKRELSDIEEGIDYIRAASEDEAVWRCGGREEASR